MYTVQYSNSTVQYSQVDWITGHQMIEWKKSVENISAYKSEIFWTI